MPNHNPEHEQGTILHIVSSPASRLIVNGKDLEDWFVWTEAFVTAKDLNMDEAQVMLLNMAAIQCALHDHDAQSPSPLSYNFSAQLFRRLYVEAREACNAGHLEKTTPLSGGAN